MADEKTLRPNRTDDAYRPAVPSRPREQRNINDPLVELARLIGQSDPFAELGRQAATERASYAPASHDHGRFDPTRDYPHAPAGGEDYLRRAFESEPTGLRPDSPYDEARLPSDYRDSGAYQNRSDSDRYMGPEGGATSEEAEPLAPSDVPLEPHEDEMYDDAPRKRHHGVATALALIGCAVLGTAAAYGYRSYYSQTDSMPPPPVISADNSAPTKIVPPAASEQSSKVTQDRVANAGTEQIVSKQEEPVVLKEVGSPATPRVVLPAPVAPAQPQVPGGAVPTTTAAPSTGSGASTEPRKVKTVTIRPDGGDLAGRPVTAPAGRPAPTPPAPRAAPVRNGGPISLDPQPPGEVPAPPRRSAAVPADRVPIDTATSSTGGFLVQLASQRSESEALNAFRSLQAKFPNELGGRQPIVRRADLGNKGVYYRTNVGPFASVQEAARFCSSYKAAGGQCVVPNN